jgi:hypothetical protein
MLGIGQLPVVQIGVVEPAVRLQGDGELPILVGVGEDVFQDWIRGGPVRSGPIGPIGAPGRFRRPGGRSLRGTGRA